MARSRSPVGGLEAALDPGEGRDPLNRRREVSESRVVGAEGWARLKKRYIQRIASAGATTSMGGSRYGVLADHRLYGIIPYLKSARLEIPNGDQAPEG